jgi:hypothetical protein
MLTKHGTPARAASNFRKSRQFFRKFVEAHLNEAPADMKSLPLNHGTKALVLRDIIAAGRIQLPLEPCRVLDERIIFTFYGRPSYRANPNSGSLRKPAGALTYILLKPKAFASATLAHPLDTGAFKLELYASYVDAALSAVDFGFGPSVEDIRKVVYYFFGSNEAYLDNVPRSNLNVPAGHDEAQAFYDIISSRTRKGDERNSSIEVALAQTVPLLPEWVECIIMPNILADVENYGKVVSELGIDIRTYRLTLAYSASEHMTRILDAITGYYREKNLL